MSSISCHLREARLSPSASLVCIGGAGFVVVLSPHEHAGLSQHRSALQAIPGPEQNGFFRCAIRAIATHIFELEHEGRNERSQDDRPLPSVIREIERETVLHVFIRLEGQGPTDRFHSHPSSCAYFWDHQLLNRAAANFDADSCNAASQTPVPHPTSFLLPLAWDLRICTVIGGAATSS